jgi:hypothetical protein
VAGFRTLPQAYPLGQKWTAENNKLCKPITKDIVDGVTHELTLQDIEHDPNWITKSACIVASNVDRAIINAEAAKALGKRNNVPVLQWKRK